MLLQEGIGVVVAWQILPSPLALLLTVLFFVYANSDSVVCALLRRSVSNPVTTGAVVALSTCMWSQLSRAVAIPANVLLALVALVNPAAVACLRRMDVHLFQAANDEIVDGVKMLLLVHIRPPPRATSSRLVMLAFVRDEVIKAVLLALCKKGYIYAAGVENTESFFRLVGKILVATYVPPFLYQSIARA